MTLAALATPALSVREITAHIKRLLDRDEILQDSSVRGEISNFTRHSSGHLYFSLKDEAASLSCVCFRGNAASLRFDPRDGDRVVATGSVTVYEKQGRYQLIVRTMEPDGAGALAAALEALRAKLEAEGLFDPSRKRPLPRFPRRVALCTSPTGAAVRDLLTILSRRYPLAEVVLIPTIVQGEAAPASIVEALRTANAAVAADVIILGRGGGSIEDLWAFNDEAVARAIFASATPTISAVGHETDVTLADMVADVRAPTPSAAAELAVPDARELAAGVETAGKRLVASVEAHLARASGAFARLAENPLLRRPEAFLEQRELRVDEAAEAIADGLQRRLERAMARVEKAGASLRALDPRGVLGRGYALLVRATDGHVVDSVSAVATGDAIQAQVADGTIGATVTELRAAEAV